jgi:cation transport ATPase
MNSEQSIQPLNVAAATLLVELLLITLLAITSSLFQGRRWEPERSSRLGLPAEGHIAGAQLRRSPTLFVALASFAVLLISDELYSIWSPIFQGVGINTISAAAAIGTVFILNLFLVGYLMYATGGSRNSPFLSALFTIPALAIFLRLPPSMFTTYAVVACVIYLVLLAPSFERVQSSQSAAAFMNISCLLLSMFTGYITRPVPINELKAAMPHPALIESVSKPSAIQTPESAP